MYYGILDIFELEALASFEVCSKPKSGILTLERKTEAYHHSALQLLCGQGH
jgi:hypothetical protein